MCFITISCRFQYKLPNNSATFHYLRSLQVIQVRFNQLFRDCTSSAIFTNWINGIIYCVSAVILRATFPWPEYLLFPACSLGTIGLGFALLRRMAEVKRGYQMFETQKNMLFTRNNIKYKYFSKFYKSVRPLGIEIGNYNRVGSTASVEFLRLSFDYVITSIIALR